MERLAREMQDRLVISLRRQREEEEGGLNVGSFSGRSGTGGSSMAHEPSHPRESSILPPPETGRNSNTSIARGPGNVSVGDLSNIDP